MPHYWNKFKMECPFVCGSVSYTHLPVTESLADTGYDGTAMLEYLKSKCGCVVIDAKKVCEPFGSSRYFNIAILGAFPLYETATSSLSPPLLQKNEYGYPMCIRDRVKYSSLLPIIILTSKSHIPLPVKQDLLAHRTTVL